MELDRKISLGNFKGPEAAWQATEEAKAIFEQIKTRIYSQRSVDKGKRA
jgi:hypothetical protein